MNGEENKHVLFQEIVDHKYDGKEVKKQNAFSTTRTGTNHRRYTTKGVGVLFQWKDGRTTYETLKDMKNSYPVQMAEYAVHQRIAGRQYFAWWIQHVLEKHNHIIGYLKSKYWIRTHKFSANIPKLVQEANAFDE